MLLLRHNQVNPINLIFVECQRSVRSVYHSPQMILNVYAVFYIGTGKTATFSISILQSLDTTLRETQVLCLSPTRELAVQIQKVILALGDFMNVQCHAVSYIFFQSFLLFRRNAIFPN